ncbi:MAG: hypothetical protein AAFZ63_07580 [Bacteroidota bacterium]
MRKSSLFILGFFAFFLSALIVLVWASNRYDGWSKVRVTSFYVPDQATYEALANQDWGIPAAEDLTALPTYLQNSLAWLAESQAADGGWGAGLHAHQNIRDPHAVATDPATTALAAMAILRAGSTLSDGPYRTNLNAATEYLLSATEGADHRALNITELEATQPQTKLGDNVDVALAAQYFARLTPYLADAGPTYQRITAALDRCIAMIEAAQLDDGSWSTRGWARVLNSSMSNNALELAERVGRPVNRDILERSQNYQRGNVYADGSVRTESAAGVPLYALSSCQRATASSANTTRQALASEMQQTQDTLSQSLAVEALQRQGYAEEEANQMAADYIANVQAARQVLTDDVQRGFGNNGGEEFLSHMLTSESLAALGGENWDNWYLRMNELYSDIQNSNSSWSGHHCITSPVFCTAAVVMAVTADREPKALMAVNG